ncbi:hypothetical protein GCM10010293_09980 [Streptomyces griseoflavus]|nr:hypothetical protein GCM10010293_09980 [Streptomyces griseoflavus]
MEATAPAMTRMRLSRSTDGSSDGGIHAGWNTALATWWGFRKVRALSVPPVQLPDARVTLWSPGRSSR